MPDHDLLFNNLNGLLRDQVTPHVALLESKDCPNVKTVMSKIMTQFMKHSNLVMIIFIIYHLTPANYM